MRKEYNFQNGYVFGQNNYFLGGNTGLFDFIHTGFINKPAV